MTSSLSQYLSKAGAFQPLASTEITHNGITLEGSLLICLVLNEECRKKNIGMVYHLKPRSNRNYGHACDLVLKHEEWTDACRRLWDGASWVKRLELCAISNAADYAKIDSSKQIIPICARILAFEETDNTPYGDANAFDPMQEMPANPLPDYAKSDPAVAANLYRYSRSIEAVCSYLILYPSLHRSPIICPVAVFEDSHNTTRTPTPNDLSESFHLEHGWINARDIHAKISKRMYKAAAARYMAAGHPNSTNAEVIDVLLEAWNDEANGVMKKQMVANGDRVRWSWQEVKNVLGNGTQEEVDERKEREARQMVYWPKTQG